MDNSLVVQGCPAGQPQHEFTLEGGGLKKSEKKNDTLAKEFKCGECGGLFTNNGNLVRHKEVIHKKVNFEDISKISCNICGKIFSREDSLMRHMKSVHDKSHFGQFECELCNTKFARKENFLRHMQGKTVKEKLFKHKCAQCEKAFCTGKLLRKHFNSVHRTFACGNCALGCPVFT